MTCSSYSRMQLNDFEIQVLPIKDKIFRFAKRLLTIPMDAEDATQEVFIKLWAKKEQLSQYNSIEAFAMTITRNLCLDLLKSKKRQTVELHEEAMVSEKTPFQQAEITDNMALMNKVLDNLPEQQKAIVQLRDIEGYGYEEIAEIMGLTVNTIRVNLSRARKKVKSELTKVFDYELKTS